VDSTNTQKIKAESFLDSASNHLFNTANGGVNMMRKYS